MQKRVAKQSHWQPDTDRRCWEQIEDDGVDIGLERADVRHQHDWNLQASDLPFINEEGVIQMAECRIREQNLIILKARETQSRP
jgi:hypothetical protein